MSDFWRVSFAEDEIMLEFVRDEQIVIILSIEQNDIGYAFRKNGQFCPGSHDATTDLPGAIEEIQEYVNAAVSPQKEPS